jgi:very-short-patch-repair endonuclease
MTEGKWIPSNRLLNHSERRLITLLKSLHLAVIPQATDGHWTIDAYLPPPIHAAVEVDGPSYHTKPEDVARDQVRQNALRADGMIIIRVWSPDLYSDEGRAKAKKHILTRLVRDRGTLVRAPGAEKVRKRLRRRNDPRN